MAEQVTDSKAESNSVDCPEGPWHCGAMFFPWGMRVSGHTVKQGPNDGCASGQSLSSLTHDVYDGQPWEAWVPQSDPAGIGYGKLEVCTCQNMEHWADDRHEALLCPQECAKGADN